MTGGSGLVGKHLKDILPDAVYMSSKDYDLTDLQQVRDMRIEADGYGVKLETMVEDTRMAR